SWLRDHRIVPSRNRYIVLGLLSLQDTCALTPLRVSRFLLASPPGGGVRLTTLLGWAYFANLPLILALIVSLSMPETSRSRKDNEHLTANSVRGLFSRKSMTGLSSPKMTGRMLRDRTD